MAISMEFIKQLREKTNCGIADCKAALEESGGNLEQAAQILRQKGISKATKRADREASEGVILAGANDAATEGYMVEVNSETDFVARNEQFQNFARQIFELVKTKKPATIAELLVLPLASSTVREQIENLSGVIGEKLAIKRIAVIAGDTVASYIHAGGRIGVLIALDKTGQEELARDLAMQVAAANPKYLDINEAQTKGAEEIASEQEIYREQLKAENKPEQMWDKIIAGKLQKYYQDVCLLEQEYIKDDKQKVKEILGEVKVEKFVRYSL
ncbi:MAG: translation elongation factor Ts [Patescibacteria group bacterium]